jgi:hypothetical protein
MAEVRILSHMNKDHALSVEDYLVVYGNVPIGLKISNIKMTEISLKHLTISFKHEDIEFDVTKIIPFEPPLESLSEARVRLVEMAKFAAAERGLAHFQVKGYKKPALSELPLALLIISPLLVFLFPVLLKNQYVARFLSGSTVSSLVKYSIHIYYASIVIHALEAYFLLEPLMERYRVPTEFKIEWYVTVLLEGFPAIKRFRKLVAEHENH